MTPIQTHGDSQRIFIDNIFTGVVGMSSAPMLVLVVLLAIIVTIASGKHYAAHNRLPIVANTVGPFNNPTETYPYYHLPFCEGTGQQRRHKQDLGETLSGSRKVATPYDVTFLDPVPWRSLVKTFWNLQIYSN